MELFEYRTSRENDLLAINALLKELDPQAPTLTPERLQKICSAPQMHVFVVRDSENIIGMATLEVGETMLGTQGYVHDVVV
ncbi:MAG: hypothetical protein HYV25_00655, partial [Candidatus Harrisonbacteria bacterium]|nr:hypothetical protein [Candidatus Harrisonbacteria bacterium]